jgi:hypothetical protein
MEFSKAVHTSGWIREVERKGKKKEEREEGKRYK